MRPRRNRLRCRLRVSGWVFLLILFLCLLAAWNTGSNLLYLITAGVGSIVVLSAAVPGWMLRKLAVTREAPGAVYRDQPFFIQVRVANYRRLLPAVDLCVESEDQPGVTGAYVVKVPRRSTAVVNVRYHFPRRGVYVLPPAVVVTTFPFGLVERWRRFADAHEVIVYPRVQSVRMNSVEQMAGGRYLARTPNAHGDEFFGLREYVVGDDLRHIAWKISARLGTWVIREHALENARYVVFALDSRVAGHLGDFDERFEEAVELVASLAISLVRRQYNVALETPDRSLEGGEGSGHEHRILDTLARVQSVPEDRAADFEAKISDLQHGLAAIIVVSPDPAKWGRRAPFAGTRFLHPKDVIHA